MDTNDANYMDRQTFFIKLEEFNGCTLAAYSRACKKAFLKYGLKSWNDAPEEKLGKIFKDMRKALVVCDHRANSKTKTC